MVKLSLIDNFMVNRKNRIWGVKTTSRVTHLFRRTQVQGADFDTKVPRNCPKQWKEQLLRITNHWDTQTCWIQGSI